MARATEKRNSTLVAGGLIGVAVLLGYATVKVTAEETPNRLAAALLQAGALIFGTVGSFVFGRVAAADAAREVIRPHARSAFRRVRNLYAALGRQREAIAAEQLRLEALNVDGTVDFERVRASLNLLETMVVEQISTADDALEDWRDLVPEEVSAIEEQARREAP